MAKQRVAVIFGGRSGEHEISLISAQSVMANLDPAKYEIVPIGITKQGRWMAGPSVWQALAGQAPWTDLCPVALVPDEPRGRLVELGAPEGRGVAPFEGALDVVFPVLHGPYGEDGTIQGLLEMVNLPYVGAGVLASAVGMDKAFMKMIWRQRGLPTVDFLVLRRHEWLRHCQHLVETVEQAFGYPCFVKPANMGSSVGVHKVRSRVELEAAVADAAAYDAKLLVEPAIDARELECSVLGNESPRASVVGEIVPSSEFYDYRAKYLDQGSQLIIPADLPPGKADEIRTLALQAFLAIDGSGMARVDFFLERRTGRVLLNEINTIPGFTSISMYPKLWEAAGLPYPALLDELIALALERHAERARNRVDYRPEAGHRSVTSNTETRS